MEAGWKTSPSPALERAHLRHLGRRAVATRLEPAGGLTHRQVPSKDSRRRKILDAIEPTLALLAVHEVAIPLGLMGVDRIGVNEDRRDSGIWFEDNASEGR